MASVRQLKSIIRQVPKDDIDNINSDLSAAEVGISWIEALSRGVGEDILTDDEAKLLTRYAGNTSRAFMLRNRADNKH